MLGRLGLLVLQGLALTALTVLASVGVSWLRDEGPTWLFRKLGVVTSPGLLGVVTPTLWWLDAALRFAMPSGLAWGLAGRWAGALAGAFAGFGSIAVAVLVILGDPNDFFSLHWPFLLRETTAMSPLAGLVGSLVGAVVVGVARGRGAALGPGARWGLAGGFSTGFIATFASGLLPVVLLLDRGNFPRGVALRFAPVVLVVLLAWSTLGGLAGNGGARAGLRLVQLVHRENPDG